MRTQDLQNIRPFPGKNKKSTWLIAETPTGETVFLKKYWEGQGSPEKHGNAARETLSYSNLSLPFMLKHYGSDSDEGYIILEYVDGFVDLEPTKRDIEEMADIVFDVFRTVDHSFLPVRCHVPMEEKINILKAEGFLDCEKTIGLYLELKDEIARHSNYFCHNDYMLQNIKRRKDGRIAVFDFELANKGHFMNDLAVLYIDLIYVPEMQRYLIEYLSQKEGFNRTVFDVLVWRRAIGQVYALRRMRNSTRPKETGMKILDSYS